MQVLLLGAYVGSTLPWYILIYSFLLLLVSLLSCLVRTVLVQVQHNVLQIPPCISDKDVLAEVGILSLAVTVRGGIVLLPNPSSH